MTPATPIPPSAASPTQSPQAMESSQNGLTAEQRLIDYIVRFQAQGLASAQHLGNPAAISGEALKALKGYLERAAALQDKLSEKGTGMSSTGDDGAFLTEAQLPDLPAGPARAPFEPTSRIEGVGGRTESLSMVELQRVMDVMLEIMHYSLETSMVTSATGNVSKSVSTLIRGQ